MVAEGKNILNQIIGRRLEAGKKRPWNCILKSCEAYHEGDSSDRGLGGYGQFCDQDCANKYWGIKPESE